jgi:asparaginyl-tRNA synthetase
MYDIQIRQIAFFNGHKVRLYGWVTHIRQSGKLVFIELRDGSGDIQCVVFAGEVDQLTFENAKKLTIESSCMIEGIVRQDARSPIGFEIGVTDIQVFQIPDEDFPVSPKEHGVAFLMEHRHLWLRSKMQRSIQKIRATVVKSARDYLDNQGFILFDAPILTPVACEGTTTLFETTYFDQKAYLTQSGQLYDEAGAMALGKVYSFGPTFRAEKSKTRRHLTEFWMVEPEAAFFDLNAIMSLAENFVAYIIQQVVATNKNDLIILERDIEKIAHIIVPFPRLEYCDALAILEKKGMSVAFGEDFGAEHETILSSQFDMPVMVHRYPTQCKAFYMKADPENTSVSLCVDMLAPEGYGEIIGGGQREDDYHTLKEKILENGLNEEQLSWYLDLRKFGSVPHGGFGMGLERFVTWICGLHHVRETIPFPRMLDKVWP